MSGVSGSKRTPAAAAVLACVAGLTLTAASTTSAAAAGGHHHGHHHGHRPAVRHVLPTGSSTEVRARVTIVGSQLRHVRAVWFGTRRGSHVHVVSSRLLRVTAPQHRAGEVRVRVVTRDGHSRRSAAAHFAYREQPPSSLSAEAGASGLPALGALTLGWVASPSFDASRVMIRRAAGRVAPATVDDGTRVTTLPATATSYVDRGLTAGKRYAYALFSRSSSGAWSKPAPLVTWIPRGGWTGTRIDPYAGPPAVASCVAGGFCAVGDESGDVLTHDGTGWAGPTPISRPGAPGSPEVDLITAMACGSASFCVAGTHSAAGHEVSYWNGSSWSASQSMGSFPATQLEGLSCAPGTTTCLGTMVSGTTVRYDGTSWSVVGSPSDTIQAVSCATADYCMGLSSQGVFVWTGGSWGTRISLGATAYPTAVSCGGVDDCVVTTVGDTTDGGSFAHHLTAGTWTTTTMPGVVSNLSCTSPTWCLAVADGGQASIFDGDAWTSAASPGAGVESLSCGQPTSCLALGGSTAGADPGLVASALHLWDGISWTAAQVDPPRGGMTDVSCASRNLCAAVDGNGNALVQSGGTWSAPVTVEPHVESAYLPKVGQVSCPAATFCAAIFTNGYATTYDGSTWSASQHVDFNGYVNPPSAAPGRQALDCASASFCVAVDWTDVLVYDGTSWSTPTLLDNAGLVDVSCPSSSACIALTEDGRALRYDGRRWSPAGTDRLGSGTAEVSCSSATSCLAVGGQRSSQWDGTQWSRTATVHRSGPTQTRDAHWSGLSCATAHACAAYDSSGAVYSFDGADWSAGVHVADHSQNSPDQLLSGLSCGGAGSCRVVSARMVWARGS